MLGKIAMVAIFILQELPRSREPQGPQEEVGRLSVLTKLWDAALFFIHSEIVGMQYTCICAPIYVKCVYIYIYVCMYTY